MFLLKYYLYRNMYDIEFSLGICADERYLQRLWDFKRYGLTNIGNKKVLVKLAAGTEKFPNDIFKNWPVDVEVITNNIQSNHIIPKLYHYYANMTENDVARARWFCKLDDDSITDVAGLVDNLDWDYDYQRDYYIVTFYFGPPTMQEHLIDVKLAKEFGFEKWFENGDEGYPEHEVEACILSQTTMQRIVTNNTAKKFLLKRAHISDGFSDIALGYAARMCKVCATKSRYICQNALLWNFSPMGGKMNHVHWLSHDTNTELFNIWKKKVNNTLCEKTDNIIKKDFVLTRGNKLPITIRFCQNGTIWSSEHTPVKFWYIEGNFLSLVSANGEKNNKLFFKREKQEFIGKKMFIHPKKTYPKV